MIVFETVTATTARGYYHTLAENLGCSKSPSPLECLRSKPAQLLVDESLLFSSLFVFPFVWMPVIEDPSLSSQPFIPRDPLETLESGDFNKDVEVIMGTNSAEGIIMVYDALLNSSKWRKYADDWENSGTRALFNIADPRFAISF